MPKTVLNEVDAPTHIARSREWEKSISGRDTAKEKAALYDKKGHLIAARQGAEHSTGFSENELNQARGGTIIHNHPSGHSFSHEDLSLAHVKGLTVRAVGTDKEGNVHTYQAKARRPSQSLGEKITREFPGEEKQAKASLLKIKPGMSDEQLFRMSREAAVARTCKENDLTYKHTYLKPEVISDEMGNGQVKEIKQDVTEFSPDQARDSNGRWISGDTGFGPLSKDSEHDIAKSVHTGLAARQGAALTQYAQHHADKYQSDPDAINRSVQKGEKLSSDDARTVEVMDHLTKESNIPHDLTMYKGVNANVAKGFEGLEPGSKFRESGFVTGHLSSKDAKVDMGEGGGFVKVDVPGGNKGYAHLESDQTHITLPRSQKYEYVGKSSVAVPGTGKMAPVYHVRLSRFG